MVSSTRGYLGLEAHLDLALSMVYLRRTQRIRCLLTVTPAKIDEVIYALCSDPQQTFLFCPLFAFPFNKYFVFTMTFTVLFAMMEITLANRCSHNTAS